jgi:hypothetical protein
MMPGMKRIVEEDEKEHYESIPACGDLPLAFQTAG